MSLPNTANNTDAFMRAVKVHAARAENGENSARDDSLILGIPALQSLTTPQAIHRVAMQFSQYMPERREGEIVALAKSLVRGDKAEAKQQAIRLFVYELSNNLIEDKDNEYIEDRGKNDVIINMFRNIGLPMSVWKAHFAKTLKELTGRAFIDNLFDAAVDTASLDILGALLEIGADPDKILTSCMTGQRERPVQVAVDCRVRSLAMLTLLIRFGANVRLTTDDNPTPALHDAAEECSVDFVKALVEAGADVREPKHETGITGSVLTSAVQAGWRIRRTELEHSSRRESPGLATVKYLLLLFDRERDRELIQSGFIAAAASKRTDMIPFFLEAGADVNATSSGGFTALIAATRRSYEGDGLEVVTALLGLGADPSKGVFIGPRKTNVLLCLHVAAAQGDGALVNLFIERGASLDDRVCLRSRADAGLLGGPFDCWRADFGFILRHMARCDTALRLAVFRDKPRESKGRTKGPEAALALVRAGASLYGGEFARAGSFDSTELLRELIAHGADVNELDWTRRTALLTGIINQNFDNVSFLLEAGAKLRGEEISWAVKSGSKETVELLVQHGASLDEKASSRETLMESAAMSKNWDLVSWIVEKKGEDGAYYSPTALLAAVSLGVHRDPNWRDHFEILTRHRPSDRPVCIMEATAMGCAAMRGHQNMLAWLLNHLGAPVNTECMLPVGGDKALYILADGEHGTLGRAYEKRFWHDSSNLQCSVLTPAIMSSDVKNFRMLRRLGCKPDRFSLLAAVENGRIRDWEREEWEPSQIEERVHDTLCVVLELTNMMGLEDINQPAHPLIYTPLQGAVRFERPDMVRHLLSLGVDPNAPAPPYPNPEDEWDPLPPRTALQAAVEVGDTEIIDLLIESGAEVNGAAAHRSGATALQIAASTGQIGTARKLMSLGADVNGPRSSENGRMALEAAAERGRLDMVQFLLESGAKMTGDYGRVYYRAVWFARKNGHTAVERLIREWKREEGQGATASDGESTAESLFYDSDEEGSEDDSEEPESEEEDDF